MGIGVSPLQLETGAEGGYAFSSVLSAGKANIQGEGLSRTIISGWWGAELWGVSSSLWPGGTRCFGKCFPVDTTATVCSHLGCIMNVPMDTGKAASVPTHTLKC